MRTKNQIGKSYLYVQLSMNIANLFFSCVGRMANFSSQNVFTQLSCCTKYTRYRHIWFILFEAARGKHSRLKGNKWREILHIVLYIWEKHIGLYNIQIDSICEKRDSIEKNPFLIGITCDDVVCCGSKWPVALQISFICMFE